MQNLDEDETIIQFALSLNKRGGNSGRGHHTGVNKKIPYKPNGTAHNRVAKPYGR